MIDKEFFNDTAELAGIMQGETEFISIIADGDDSSFNKMEIPEELPILPLRGNVIFPGVVIPVTAARNKSIRLVKDAKKNKQFVGVVAQKNDSDDPFDSDLYTNGTVVRILKTLEMPNGNTMVIIQGIKRFTIENFIQEEPYFVAKIRSYADAAEGKGKTNFNNLVTTIKETYEQLARENQNLPPETLFAIKNLENKKLLVNFISSNLPINVADKQLLLEAGTLTERAEKLLEFLTKEIQVAEVRNQIHQKVRNDLDKQQRDHLLNQQLRVIQEELGGAPHEQEIQELRERAEKKNWPEEIAKVFDKEMNKLQRLHPSSPDFSVQINYLNTLVDLPWNECTSDNFDLKHAQEVLDGDHFGLDKVKKRILEYLAVLKLKGDMKSPILCLVGPPGVGKTSLGKSLASALGRKYVRMALGGLRDEAEIRGHRKTYIGAMPGRIVQSILKVKSSNPVFLLDEIDKVLGMSVNGDPAAALLEVLDPEQNTAFHDNYLEVDYDLSKVMFVATANTLNTIHPALRDRMEIIEIPGYILEEKIEIAKRHLVPKQLKENGLKSDKVAFSDSLLEKIIDEYTRESGVRQLEKNIAKIIRNRAVDIVNKKKTKKEVKAEELKTILGLPIHTSDSLLQSDMVGVVTGLAWTSVGGEILFIEASLSKGKGSLTLTGNLGDVMKESATLAFEYLKAHTKELNIDPVLFEENNVHVHVPEGATPKDGPSAGITMFTALASAFTKRKVRSYFAMTGEITLRGKVLPVGGIKEKILAAKRSKITDIILSKENKRDIEDIKPEYLQGLKFHYVDQMIEIIDIVLM